MKMMGTLLTVKDMAVAKRFYTGLLEQPISLNLDDINVTIDERFSLQTLDTWAGFIDKNPEDIKQGGLATELYFEVEDLDAFLKKLAAWPEPVDEVCPLKEFPWGQRSVHLYDPDRHVVEVGESMKTVVKRFLRGGMTTQQVVERTGYPIEFMEMCAAELEAEK